MVDVGGWTRMLAYLRFRSGPSAAPVPQTDLREFAVTLETPAPYRKA
jgi:hypothetical protein